MTKKSRTILFYSLIVLFLLIAPASILYSQGYRFDFGTMKVVKTGAIFLNISPGQAEVYIDGKIAGKTSFFTGSSLMIKLSPKTYKVQIEKEGYFTWEKNLQVKEQEVTEAKSIILFPENPIFTDITTTTQNATSFWATLTGSNQTATPTISVPKNILAFQEIGSSVYFLNASGTVYKSDSSFATSGEINQVPFPTNRNSKYKLEVFRNYIFLQSDQTLYLFNPGTKSFEKFFDDLSNLRLSPDGRKLVYYSDNEIWILFLDNIYSAPQRQAGEKIFLTRFSEKIGNVFWLNSDYLIFDVGNKIEISEIDNRDHLNVYDIGEFSNPQIFWSQNDARLYVLSSGKIFLSQALLP